jgi:hypothetical protein
MSLYRQHQFEKYYERHCLERGVPTEGPLHDPIPDMHMGV